MKVYEMIDAIDNTGKGFSIVSNDGNSIHMELDTGEVLFDLWLDAPLWISDNNVWEFNTLEVYPYSKHNGSYDYHITITIDTIGRLFVGCKHDNLIKEGVIQALRLYAYTINER